MIFYAWGHRNESIFVLIRKAMQNPFRLWLPSSCWQKKSINIFQFQFIQSPISLFLNHFRDFLRRFEMVCQVSMILLFLLKFGTSVHEPLNSASLKTFSSPPPCQSSMSKSSVLKRWNHSRLLRWIPAADLFILTPKIKISSNSENLLRKLRFSIKDNMINKTTNYWKKAEANCI